VINPIEVVKIRLQIQGELTANAPKKYRGFLHGIYTIAAEESIGGLYKG
jgi:solute carrier family 25 protein 34/35